MDRIETEDPGLRATQTSRRFGTAPYAAKWIIRRGEMKGSGGRRLMESALQQAGLLLEGSPDAPGQRLDPGTWTQAYRPPESKYNLSLTSIQYSFFCLLPFF